MRKTTHENSGAGFVFGLLAILVVPYLIASGAASKLSSLVSSKKQHVATTDTVAAAEISKDSDFGRVPSGVYVGWTKYTNDYYNFTFNFPATWLSSEKFVDNPKSADIDDLVTTLTSTQNAQLNSVYFSINKIGLEQAQSAEDARGEATGRAHVTILEKTATTLSGHPAVGYVLQSATGKTKVWYVQVDERTYRFSSTAYNIVDPEAGPYEETFDAIVRSFTVAK